MMAFDLLFLEVAKRESRAIHTFAASGGQQTFLFREFYCTEPGCDCRRVVLQVEWIDGKRVAATINYAFEPSRRRDEPQLFLDPLNPQSPGSNDLLAVFSEMIEKDREYRACLVRHYEIWKQVVDDPAHPDHRKVRGAAHDDPAFRPAFPPRKKRPARAPRRPSTSQELQLLARAGARTDSKVQQRFGRLIKKVDQLKQRLRTWQDAQPVIQRQLADYLTVNDTHQRVAHDLVCLFDRVYPDPIFSKLERTQLGALICEIAKDLLAQGGHEDLKPTYNRHSRSDFDAERVAEDAADASAMKSVLEAVFEMDLGDDDVSSIDELHERAQAQLRAHNETREARRTRAKKSSKQQAKEAAREDEHAKVGKALQELYRKLALALHPDLEQDPDERSRKTVLMQQVNVAYEAKDLLQLLELQLRFEQVDATKVDTIAEDRLRHYNTILDEQATQLELELHEVELRFRLELASSPSARLSPKQIIARLGADTDDLKRRAAMLRRDLEAFQDVRQLKVWLKSFAAPRARDRDGPGLFG
jgi:hypothetical protein